MALISSKLRYLLLVYALFAGIQFALRWKNYDITAKNFKSIAAKAAASPTAKQSLATLQVGLRSHYEPILPKSVEWHAVQLGGLSLRIFPLYSTFTEYTAAFSAPFETTGRAGLHWANSTCTVLQGHVARFSDDTQDEKIENFGKSDAFRHGQFESYIYRLEKDTLVACYGRGFLPVSATAIAVSEITEPVAFLRLLLSQTANYYNSLSHSLQKTFQHYKQRASGEL